MEEEAKDVDTVEGVLEAVVEEMVVVVAEAAEEVVEMKNSLIVWILSIQLYHSLEDGGQNYVVGQYMSCNRATAGNVSYI